MAVDLICPDCGGIIGGQGVDADGRGPCRCFHPEPDSAASSERNDSSDTVSIPAPPANGAPAATTPAQPVKLCIVCGKNVAGHRRIKDSRGYLCYDCYKKEVEAEQAGTFPCAECGKRVKPAGLVERNGVRICRKCYNDHKEAEKKIVRKVATHQYDEHERRNIKILAAIFGILSLIVIWQLLKNLF